MPASYQIHPAIGIARLGNSPTEFCISPEEPAALPLDCDALGNPLLAPNGAAEVRISTFKDTEGRIKRQAARFQIYVYDEASPQGRPLQLGDPISGGGNDGVLVDIQWRVYLANKKAVWYQFLGLQGEHGYGPDHPLRNAAITDPNARQQLIIDPGPQIINCTDRRNAHFHRDVQERYAPTFPPPLQPNAIDTLGEIKSDDAGRLLVLGGFGNSGSFNYNDFGQPRIDTFANNDGWFDDTSDGPVMARLVMYSARVGQLRYIDVEYPAWVLVASPAFVPQILNMVTVEDVVSDLMIRQFADRTDLFGEPGTFDQPRQIDAQNSKQLQAWRASARDWNPHYKPWFFRDIWTILFRPDEYGWLNNVLAQSNYPHDQNVRGNFDVTKLATPPVVNRRALAACYAEAVAKHHSGELFAAALDPALVLLDSALDQELRRAVGNFVAAVAALPGMPTTPAQIAERVAYQEKVADVRRQFTTLVGDLLFGELKANLQQMVQKFNQLTFDNHFTAANATPTADPELAHYQRQWQTVHATPAPGYREATDGLARTANEIIDAFCRDSHAAWQATMDTLRDASDGVMATGEVDWQAAQSALRQAGSDLLNGDLIAALRSQVQETLRAYRAGKVLHEQERHCREKCTYDPYRSYRQYLYALLRQPGEENTLQLTGKPNRRTTGLPLMPLLAGDNPVDNTLPAKFLRLTDLQLYLLRQWANGHFYNEVQEGWATVDPYQPYRGWQNKSGRELDRGVLFNLLGGAFFPGGEIGWIIRNPAIYHAPFRLRADPTFASFRQTAAQANQQRGGVPGIDYASYTETPLSQGSNFAQGLQPGDLTKMMPVPWQADFNECTTQSINVTYEAWNQLYPASEGDPLIPQEERIWQTMWWPAHRPLQTYEVTGFSDGSPRYQMLNWSRGIPGTNAGDLKMVTAWSGLGFVVRNPYEPESALDQPSPMDAGVNKYISVERNTP